MGIVYKARDRSLDEEVAIKVLRPDFARDPLMAQRFKSEIRLARRVRHRNVCAIHDFGEADGLLYISMELIQGVDLKRIVREQGALPIDRACDVLLQVAAGLQAVHEAGIIHRDLKTPNILLEPNGVARLMDFGIAKREDSEGGVTVTGQVVGTPEYMSPEQAQGQKLDARTDVYSLGVVAYEVLTGRVPFRGETPISTILKHIHDPPPLDGPPADRLPLGLREVLRRALAKSPGERPSSASAFAEAIRGARAPSLRQQRLSTEALEATTRVAAPAVRRRSRRRAGLAAAALAVLGIAGLWAWRSDRARTGSPADRPPSSLAPSPSVVPAAPPPRRRRAGADGAASPDAHPDSGPRRPAADRDSSPARPPVSQPTPAATPTPVRVTGNGLLQIGVRPWARVIVDGREVGTTPLDRIPLPAGRHVVGLRHPAYQPVERELLIAEGETARLIFDFAAEGVPPQP